MGIWEGLQGKVPVTKRNFDKIDEWVQVVCVCVSVTEVVVSGGEWVQVACVSVFVSVTVIVAPGREKMQARALSLDRMA